MSLTNFKYQLQGRNDHQQLLLDIKHVPCRFPLHPFSSQPGDLAHTSQSEPGLHNQAHDAGHFSAEIAAVEAKTKKGKQLMTEDDHPRPQTTLEQLAKLQPVFKKGGTVTAANAPGVSDGAAAVVIASEDVVKQHKLTPLARIVVYHVSGCDPSTMGSGPVPAISGALKKAGLTRKDMDLVEVNEAFAPQYLSAEKALGLDPENTNVNGGAIALGHPLVASGSRITAHLVHKLRRRGGTYAVGSACTGGGQGIAIIFENTH
ncbi:3-ketoacyl-CoA thiolase, mitochondrial-like [Polyodon spathula]|uniref:3-ketoacyl-CoA thiolase, mitochondrial-like n=1 Tax=Polyodon spathula TaxID=7913 RepID=UPI001B7F3FE4|nr:3-ketoacyl-CoA thiolase, mitochondrial-like [Polyodon spathula]